MASARAAFELYGINPYNTLHSSNGRTWIGANMPAVMERQDKQCRIDIRLTQPQRASYERAASLRGQTLTQWATSHLDESAKRDIREATTTVLSPEAFDEFCAMLEAPMPKAAQDLFSRRAVWE